MLSRGIVTTLFLFVLVFCSVAPAAELVVMNTDSKTVPGAKVYTVGVQVTQADVAASIADFHPNVVLGVQEVDFIGNILNSQQTTPFNYRSLQSIQSQYMDNAAYNNPVAPGGVAGPPVDLGSAGDHALYASSWWYAGNGGQLIGVTDSNGNIGPVTTIPAADGSGVYAVGPAANLGTTGLTWRGIPESFPGTPGMTMSEAIFGVAGSSAYTGYLDQAPMSNQFVNGVLTVPLAQVVTDGNINFDFSTTGTSLDGGPLYGNNFITLTNTPFNFLGGNWLVDPHAVLDYSTNTIHSQLAAGGGTGTVGGIQVDPSMITSNGNLTAGYAATSTANLADTIGAAAAGQINFALAGSTVQAWDVQYTGVLTGTNTVVFHYDPTLIGNTPEADLRIEHFVNDAWVVPAGQVVDTTAHTITFQTDSFSPFVLAQVPEPSSVALLAIGALAACVVTRKRAMQR